MVMGLDLNSSPKLNDKRVKIITFMIKMIQLMGISACFDPTYLDVYLNNCQHRYGRYRHTIMDIFYL